MDVNILITSVSRKVWLIKALKDAMDHEGVSGKVITVDTNPLSAGLYVSDGSYVVPPMDSNGYLEEVLGICAREKVKLLIPTRDEDVSFFAQWGDEFNRCGTHVLTADPQVIGICRDKYEFYKYLKSEGFSTPDTFLPEQLDHRSLKYPLMIKSRVGCGSKGVHKVFSRSEFDFYAPSINDPIVQEYIEGQEYTVDLFSDFAKNVISVVPRERIETVSGESYKGRTVRDDELTRCSVLFAQSIGISGHCCLQFIKDNVSAKLIEVNCRLGGASILSIKSGHNTPLWLIRLITGQQVEPQIGNYRDNYVMLRYLREVFLSGDELAEKS